MSKIVFAHNVYNRLKTLKDTILIEKKFFPDSHVSIASNDLFINIFQEITNLSIISFNEKPHKIGCVNGCILSIQQLLNEDFDVLIFSHDDVRINNNFNKVLNKNIEEIVNGDFDVICRIPEEYSNNYYMMEVFFLSKKVVTKIFTDLQPIKDENKIPRDIHNSISPEVWLFNQLNGNGFNIKEIKFNLNINNYNQILGEQMGYLHLNAGERGWKD